MTNEERCVLDDDQLDEVAGGVDASDGIKMPGGGWLIVGNVVMPGANGGMTPIAAYTRDPQTGK
jgi:hypothetical protein